jgi:hypothetical protein
MDKKSPKMNQPVLASRRDLRVSADSAGLRESKNRHFKNIKYKIS